MTHIIGLTGGIATGKSTVSSMFEEQGIPVLCADRMAHALMKKGTSVSKKIMDEFGAVILDKDGEIDRALLGPLVFADEEKRNKLNAIVHPEVRRILLERLKQFLEQKIPLVVLDIPLLFESNLGHLCQSTLLVYAPREIQIERIRARDHLPDDEIERRLAAQIDIEDKKSKADFIIYNDRDLGETKEQFLDLLSKLKS